MKSMRGCRHSHIIGHRGSKEKPYPIIYRGSSQNNLLKILGAIKNRKRFAPQEPRSENIWKWQIDFKLPDARSRTMVTVLWEIIWRLLGSLRVGHRPETLWRRSKTWQCLIEINFGFWTSSPKELEAPDLGDYCLDNIRSRTLWATDQ